MPLISLTKVYYTPSGDSITFGFDDSDGCKLLVIYRQGRVIHKINLENTYFDYYVLVGAIYIQTDVLDTVRQWTHVKIMPLA